MEKDALLGDRADQAIVKLSPLLSSPPLLSFAFISCWPRSPKDCDST